MARPQRLVFASDSLKGTIASARAAQLLEAAARRHFPECECRSVPMADGGDGTAEAVALACGGELRRVCVHDPLWRTVEAAYAMLTDNRAVVEMAAASGLPLLSPSEKNPLITSTYGTGELIRSALDAGAHNVDLAIGGSATNDGGMGCMRALGARFLDARGRELAGCGSDLARVAAIDLSRLDPRVARTEFHLMCDVDNPLTGPDGASAVYGPQKGATPEMVAELDAGMANYARVLAEAFWPGALTIIVPARENVPAYCRAADGTVALRASASPVVAALIRVLGAPLACTSANTHGAPAPASFDAVEPRVLAGVDIALDAGPTPCQDASTIVACAAEGVRIVRQGSLAADAIERALIRAGFASSSPAEER